MNLKRVLIAISITLIGISVTILDPPTPAVVVQPRFSGTTQPTYRGHGFTQIFKASGWISGAGVDFNLGERNRRGRVRCSISEVPSGGSPGNWRQRLLAEDSVDISRLPRRGHWVFSFRPIELDPQKTYTLAIESDVGKKEQFTLFAEHRSVYPEGSLFQGDVRSGDTLSFRIYGMPSAFDLYRLIDSGGVQPILSASGIIALLVVLLFAGGLLVGTLLVPEPAVARRRRPSRRAGRH